MKFHLRGLAAILLACGPTQAADRLVLPSTVTPTHYDIAVTPDLAGKRFEGSVRIQIEVHEPTRTIVLNAAELDLSRVMLDDLAAAPKLEMDAGRQTASLTFAAPVAAGHHLLALDYSGHINEHASGLFALGYDTPAGKKQALFTQFENSDARRFVPCWDEPALKATFTLAATVPAADMPISNMPVASTEILPDGRKRVSFAESPKMSSYLLFFGSGDFERVSQEVDGVDVGVVVKRGDIEQARYALDAAVHLLPYYEDYFGVKFPLPKLDLIAGPGQSQFFGAMENWGAIFYFEGALLIDPKISTQRDRRGIYTTVAHEMAHQWFGDLVTMSWWDDLWLNEGFASWMEVKATDHFHPEWKLWLDELGGKEGAMRVDARKGTHPIIQPVRDVLQANQAFDTITYQKGEAVIRMLEDYLGETAFQDGVRRYMAAHAYGNTVTDDLWRELDRGGGAPVAGIAHDFTRQAGIPLIRVVTTAQGLRLEQARYAEDASGRAETRWQVPVLAGAADAREPWRGLVSAGKPAVVPAGTAVGLVVNRGQAGYFRTLYTPAALRPLAAHFSALGADDQLGLLNDSRALGYSGYAPLSDFLDLSSQVAPGMEPDVESAVAERLQGLDTLYKGRSGQAAFRAHGRRVLQPLFAALGWTAQPDESQNQTLLRERLLGALSQFDDETIIAEARQRFAGYLRDPASLSSEQRRSTLRIVAEHADAATWDQLLVLARNAAGSLEKNQLYRLLGTPNDPRLAARALSLALDDTVAATTRPAIIRSVSVKHPEQAFDFTLAHLDTVLATVEPDSRTQYVPRLLGSCSDPAMIPRLHAYAKDHIPAGARREEVKTEASITYAAEVRARRLPEVDRWLAAHPT